MTKYLKKLKRSHNGSRPDLDRGAYFRFSLKGPEERRKDYIRRLLELKAQHDGGRSERRHNFQRIPSKLPKTVFSFDNLEDKIEEERKILEQDFQITVDQALMYVEDEEEKEWINSFKFDQLFDKGLVKDCMNELNQFIFTQKYG